MKRLTVIVAAGAVGMIMAGLSGCASGTQCGGPPIYVPAEPVEVPHQAPAAVQPGEDRP